jgi:16S rRNA (cytosine967-C5)-methyltransferase
MAVRAGQSGTAALAAVDSSLRPGVQSLAFRVLRSLGRAEALRQQLASRAPPPQADALLCTALALAAGDGDAPYEAFTLVDQGVEAAKRSAATAKQASFINACLRRFLRERQQLVEAANRDPVAQWNHPRWWINRLKQDHPSRWQAILRANNLQAPMTLRVNSRQATQQQYLETLAAAGIGAVPVGRQGVVLDKARAVHELPGFDTGVVSVQDAAAQMAAQLLLGGLDLQPGQANRLQVLDACAAPGGKTAHLLELADCDVTALDIDAQRCARIHETLARLGLHAQVVAADAARPDLWWNGILFDAILLDAPCTASGIVRRHPDVRWLRRETDIAQLAGVQARLLQKLWPLVKPGGRLLYCTCSVFRAEGDMQIQTFLAHNTDAVLRPSPGHLMPQTGANNDAVPDNPEGDHDGFFYALLEKRAA